MFMFLSLYLLATLYTNTMGLIILAKCQPIIKHEMELKGYRIVEKDDTDVVVNAIIGALKFLITGYYLNKALKLTGKDFDIQKIISEKLKEGEIELSDDAAYLLSETVFRDNRKAAVLSSKGYEKKSSISNNSMYTKDRLPNRDSVDRSFWEEDEERIETYISESEPEIETAVRKEPIREYIESMTDEDIEGMQRQLTALIKLKEAQKELLNK